MIPATNLERWPPWTPLVCSPTPDAQQESSEQLKSTPIASFFIGDSYWDRQQSSVPAGCTLSYLALEELESGSASGPDEERRPSIAMTARGSTSVG